MPLHRSIRILTLAVAVTPLAVTLDACAPTAVSGSRRPHPEATTEYYYGTMSTFSADGKMPYGPPVMTLVKRVVNPGDQTIVEARSSDGVSQVMTLRREEGGRFRVSASDNSLEGTIEFAGDDWSWQSWRYGILLSDGSGGFEGAGRFDGKWMESERFLVATTGERRRKIVDRFIRITSEEYAAKHAEMIETHTTPAAERR